MKLAVLGGGGVRIPAFVRAVVGGTAQRFDQIALFEPDPTRRTSIGRLCVEIAAALGAPGGVTVSGDVEEAMTGADYVFSAIRVGGDDARIVDERVALKRGLVGQETTGPGGCAMALRTIPVVLAYCEVISRLAPRAVLVNFTNPAGIITQAITTASRVRVVGVCDTPSGTISRLSDFLEVEPAHVACSYAGLNHLGWITSVVVEGEERISSLLEHYDELAAFSHRFAAFDPSLVRRVGCIPTEYLYYFYDPAAYIARVGSAGTTRGEDVRGFNERLVKEVMRAFDVGDVHDAWRVYSAVLGRRRASYMRLDVEGTPAAPVAGTPGVGGELSDVVGSVGGYEGVALQVIDGLSGAAAGRVVVNTVNGGTLGFLDPEDVVEVPAAIDPRGVAPLANPGLARSARALVMQVKEYERALVQAAVTGEADLAAVALSLHPLVPGLSAARDLLRTYQELHGPMLDYLK